jgi:hypothetical protein
MLGFLFLFFIIKELFLLFTGTRAINPAAFVTKLESAAAGHVVTAFGPLYPEITLWALLILDCFRQAIELLI